MDVITASITGVVKGLEGKLNSLAVAGVSLGQDGKLSVDDGKLSDAINSKLDQVKSLFMAVGTPTDPNVQFLSSSSKTKTSTSSGFPVVVTQAATKATATSGVAQTGPSSDTETLTFNGALFGNTAATIQLGAGNSVDDTITAINSHPTIGRLLTASKDADGKLVLTASAYGSKKSFTVVSDKAAGADNSGIGATVVTATGLNVAGTINGASATGDGQVLTGDDSSPNVAGLALLITATSAGTYGNITFTKGLGASIKDVINSLTDPTTGSLTDQDKQLQTQIDQLTDDMKRIQDSLTQRESALRQQFSTMETVVSQLRNQQARISALFSGVTG
jgi:flagellar hook-associated protein 2